MFGNAHDDRGQLILAGAVVFSLVLIGIVVVFSTTLFTANMASSSANAGVTDSEALEGDVETTVEELATRYDDDNEFREEIEEEYSKLLAERYGGSGPTIVSVSVDLSESDLSEDEATVEIVYETGSVTKERTIMVGDSS